MVRMNKFVVGLIIVLVLLNIGFVVINVIKINSTEIAQEMAESSSKGENEGVKKGVSAMRIELREGFYYEPISEEIKSKINGLSYKENSLIDYSDLRYLTVLYIDFEGNQQQGHLIVNVQVAEDVLAIFGDLYDACYPIERICLVDEYGADDERSMEDNNTSAFNFRYVDGTDTISDHSYGIAIDINPLYNPYVREGLGERNVLPVNGTQYADRDGDFPHKIVKDDVCYQAFAKRGWLWGGEWESTKDYQHFYKPIF